MKRWAAAAFVLAGWACGGTEEPVRVTVPAGSTLGTVTDTLTARGVVGAAPVFKLYARARGADRRIKAGQYLLPAQASWGDVLDVLTEGRVVTVRFTIPEGFRLSQIAPRIAQVTGMEADSVMAYLTADVRAEELELPGPGLEGFLFPDTYRFAPGVPVERVVRGMVRRYRDVWTPERRAKLEARGLTEVELMTLASIVQGEARVVDEMPRIASVYSNRLERGWPLQADPTVQYALGGDPRERLLYASLDSVADHPYNTYARTGLPPGPIGAPGEAAIDAALEPAQEDYMYFVARPDGSHVFTSTLADHNRAKAESRRMFDSLGEPAGTTGAAPSR